MNLDRNVVFMLKCIFRYSENVMSVRSARLLLLEKSQGGDSALKATKEGVKGGFMQAVCEGDFLGAYRLADTKNQAALKEGFIHLHNADTWLMDTGLDPMDYVDVPQAEMFSAETAAKYIKDLGFKK